MEVVGLLLSTIATLDLCLKYGDILIKTCKSFKLAETQVDERVLCVRSHWKRTSLQLDYLKQIWGSLDSEHQAIQSEILEVLVSKLKAAISKLDKLERPNDRSLQGQATQVNRWKFILVKESLDKVIQDLTDWQERFDPSWFLIMRIADPVIDKELSTHPLGKHEPVSPFRVNANGFRNAAGEDPYQMQSIFLPEDGLKSALIHDIPFSSARYVQRAGSDKWLVAETVSYNVDSDINLVTRDIRTLARKLSWDNVYTSGILQCRGVVRVMKKDTDEERLSFELLFKIPREFSCKPDTLRSMLAHQASHTLSERFGLAKRLARSICYVHALGFVHKNVRPETILRFKDQDPTLGLFFLIGFEAVRIADGRTLRQGDSAWEKNLYRHPDRQGLRPQEAYTMQHDIYSLGVCLLEIGLWDSFVSYDPSSAASGPGKALSLESYEFATPLVIKDHLVALAKSTLPGLMGEIYTETVVNCLTCLDKDNPDFGDTSEFLDADGVLVGVRYIEKVLFKLDGIHV